MALVVGQNSYVSCAEAEDYFETRIDSSAWHAADDEDKENALITATRIADENLFVGSAVSLNQNLAWPRKGATYFDPKYGDYVTPDSTEIPKRIKFATLELAYEMLVTENLLNPSDQSFEEITIGPITLKDSDGDRVRQPARTVPRLYTQYLKVLTQRGQPGSGGGMWWRAN